ncbi:MULTISPECIES: condensation domain-containing protein [unclassified Micromonospora]|uniref:condensation domain-containing protein n=1 Tax=unclassified Micromonospora TaxID=2617518 RepID=UPI001C21656E|nr:MULTISPECIES: condensation domain-containing protein [unclassified Micromonospora]MBU8858620.1 hypothetical protein [Micromonospora sp. WMMB482]MDM4784264.1 condensation domain-containing protein [Micromonospora sp. b486]
MSAPTSHLLPLTESQKSLLVASELAPVAHLYNTVTTFELDSARTDDEIRRALAAVVAAQPTLRTVLVDDPTPHATLTEPPAPEEVPFDTADGETVEEIVRRLGELPFDLRGGRLYHFRLVRSAGRSTLVAAVHHVVFDGYSIRPLMDDLAAALDGADVAGRRAAREETYARELALHRRTADDPATRDTARRWAEEFAGLPATRLCPGPARPTEASFLGRHVRWRLDADETEEVSGLCQRLGLSPFEFFTGAYAATLARHAAVPTAVFGAPVMSRRTAGAYALCGFFVDTLPLAVPVDWSVPVDRYLTSTVADVVQRTRGRTGIGLNQIVEQLPPGRRASGDPLVSCLIAMQDPPPPADGPVRSAREHTNDTAKFDCGFNVALVGGRWEFDLEYDQALLPAPAVEALVTSLDTAVRRAVAGPGRPLAELFTDAGSGAGQDQLVDVTGHLAPAGVPGRRASDPDGPLLLPGQQGGLVPLNETGSAPDRTAASDHGRTGGAEPVAETTEDDLQREITDLWRELLDLPEIDPDRSLLEYGAHSLLVFTALSRVRRRYQVSVPIIEFFRQPTVAAMTDAVSRRRAS